MTLQIMYPGLANSPQTELAGPIDDVQNTITLVDATKIPVGPNLATIGSDETAETVLYTGITGNDLTGVTRGFEGTAKGWSSGAKVARNFTAFDYNTLRENVQNLESNTADKIAIIDAGNYYTGTDVEAALQEIGQALNGTRGNIIASVNSILNM